MSRVEVLAPLRIETRFLSDGAAGWTLRLRVYPDDISLGRPQTPATKEELDILSDALAATADAADPEVASSVAYRAAAAALGARRAWWLWRTATSAAVDASGTQRVVDRSGQGAGALHIGKPVGLPDTLAVWLRFANGSCRMAATLAPDAEQILLDLDAERINSATAKVPALWWLDYSRAREVGLAIEISLTGAEANMIETLVVVGTGSTPAADLFAAHSASGRLAVLAQGTATNTIAGTATALAGDDPGTWLKLLDATAGTQSSSRVVLRAVGVPAAELADLLPIPGGDLDHIGPGRAAVAGLWPVLWGRTLRDVVGTLEAEPALARWAAIQLAVQGPLPAIRVGDQPYGLLPTTVFQKWSNDPDDKPDDTATESTVLAWTLPWRAGAAGAIAAVTPIPGAAPVVGASASQLLALYGRHAPSAHWRVRPVQELSQLQALQIQQGLPVSFLTDYDRAAALAWHGTAFPVGPIAAAGTRRHLPGPPRDAEDDADALLAMIREEPESLYANERRTLGLLGHLVRESMIIARATVGRAWLDLAAGLAVDPARPIPMDDDLPNLVVNGSDANRHALNTASAEGRLVAERLGEVQRGLETLVKLFDQDRETVLRTVKAALDSASFRVDPWLTGVAGRRLERMADAGAPFLLGAYGWVDAPRPWQPGQPDVLAPGPTAAGLLHAPSFAQAQMASVLRDAALRTADGGRWDIALGSDRVRDAIALGERVRLGVHPFEALGLQVEAVVGDPDVVRILRKVFPTTPDAPAAPGAAAAPNDPTRRVCDGLAVLDAARAGTLPPGLPDDLAARIKPLDDVLDTYADLLLVDGVHSLVTRSAEAASAAMEAAAGLGAPPALWGIRTPREAGTVSVSCWVVLPPGRVYEAVPDPVRVADPAFAALVPAALQGDPAAPEVARASALLGGTEPPRVPSGTDASNQQMANLADAMTADLAQRWETVADLALTALARLEGDYPMTPETLETLDRQWRLGLRPEREDWTQEDRRSQARKVMEERTLALGNGAPPTAADLQVAIRELVGRPDLPILPIVGRNLLPGWRLAPDGALDQAWLEIVAAVRPRVAPLEARQLTDDDPWPSALDAPGGDPWAAVGPVRVAYGPGLIGAEETVAVAVLDIWVDSVPSDHHVTQAAFGFNAPKTRAPQAVLLAVPPEVDVPLSNGGLLDLVLEVRETTLARAARPVDRAGMSWATPSPLVQLEQPVDFLAGWR